MQRRAELSTTNIGHRLQELVRSIAFTSDPLQLPLKIEGLLSDVIISRESCEVTQAFVRWVPTDRMLADAFTKDAGDPIDLLRACLKRSRYQISDETTVLENQAAEKQA